MSTVQAARSDYVPQTPSSLASRDLSTSFIVDGEVLGNDAKKAVTTFPNSIDMPVLTVGTSGAAGESKSTAGSEGAQKVAAGVAFVGSPASGALSLLKGLAEYVSGFADSKVVVFIGGAVGLKSGASVELTSDLLSVYSNQGGLAPFGSSTERVTPEDYAAVQGSLEAAQLNGLVLVGGAEALTDAAYLAEYFKAQSVPIKVLAAPSCSGYSLRNSFIEAPLGADTTSKTLGQLSGNLAIDGASARKYWYFMTIDGYGSSLLTLETALQSNPNLAVLNEEFEELESVVQAVSDGIARRAAAGNNFGTLLIAKGLAGGSGQPNDLAALVKAELSSRKKSGTFVGKFDPVSFDLGLQVRSGLPSLFDCEYGYSLGAACAVLLRHNASGYVAVVSGLKNPTTEWKVGAVPIVSLLELVEGDLRVPKAQLDLNSPALAEWVSIRTEAEAKEIYMNPGPVQFESLTAHKRMKLLQVEAQAVLP